jgi:hypothetical protein
MRRTYVLAIAAISVYCLTDAFASSGGEHARGPVFSAEIVNAPIVDVREAKGSDEVAVPSPQAPPNPESNLATAGDANLAAAKPSLSPAWIAAPATKTRMAAVAPRPANRHIARPDVNLRSVEPPAPAAVAAYGAPTFAAPSWQEPVQRVAVAPRSTVLAGCSGKWSQPDAAGVPVLICD